MFSRLSRYRKLPDVITVDAAGRQTESKSLRLLPQVSGTALHTIEDVDRLDHLAFQFYRQPRKWWRICDANPAFMSPLALLGKETIVTDRFVLTSSDQEALPPWTVLRRQLSTLIGVERVQVIEEQVELASQERETDDGLVKVFLPRYLRALLVTYNHMNVSAADVNMAIRTVSMEAGFTVTQERIERVGKSIIIPPDVVT